MEVVVVETPPDAVPIVPDASSLLIASRPDTVLGPATGPTTLGVSKELIRGHKEQGLSLAHVRSFYASGPCGSPTCSSRLAK